MTEIICDHCNQLSYERHVVRLKDDKDSREFIGHQVCSDEFSAKVDSIKDLHKKSLSKVLKELNIQGE